MQDIILKIEKNIWSSVTDEVKIGILDGLSGVALFYNYLHEVYGGQEFLDKLLEVIEKINSIIETEYTKSSLCSGIAGYGIMLLRLEKNAIEIDESYFENIDSILLEDFEEQSAKNDYDFMHGSMGIAMYFIERNKLKKNTSIQKTLNIFSKNLITKIVAKFDDVLKSETALDNGSCYYFGLAHGVAGYINFLAYLELNFKELEEDITDALRVCIAFLEPYKKIDLTSKQYYPNLYLFNSDSTVKARLAWCQGDLGISNSFYNAGLFLNDNDLKKEAIKIFNNTKELLPNETGINDYGICHGTIGILLQYHLAAIKFDIDNSEEINKWFKIIEEQTNNYESFWVFNQGEYIKEINILDGLVGFGLSMLTLEKKIDTKWMEILNLY